MAWIANLAITKTGYDPNNITLTWNPRLTSSHNLYWNENGGAWNFWKNLGAGESSTSDDHLTGGVTYGYYIEAGGDLSNTEYVLFGTNYSDNITVNVSVSASVTSDVHAATDSISVPVGVTTATTTRLDAVDAITVSVTVSSAERSSQSVSDTYSWYVADDSGNVYTYSPALYSDGGANIDSSWRTKTVDFAELGYENAMKWKTVYGVRVIYKDIDSSVPISFAYSKDGGATWVQATRIVGAATNKTAGKSFFFVETAQYFDFKVDVISATKAFQIIGLEIEVDPEGPQVEIT